MTQVRAAEIQSASSYQLLTSQQQQISNWIGLDAEEEGGKKQQKWLKVVEYRVTNETESDCLWLATQKMNCCGPFPPWSILCLEYELLLHRLPRHDYCFCGPIRVRANIKKSSYQIAFICHSKTLLQSVKSFQEIAKSCCLVTIHCCFRNVLCFARWCAF